MKQIVSCLIILLVVGCEKIMHEQDTQIAYINSEKELDVALAGLYSALSSHMDNDWGLVIPQQFADDFSILPLKMSPDYRHAYTYGTDLVVENKMWEQLYSIVACSNNIICQLENRHNMKNELKSGFGEALLLRAYAYFRLVRIFGQVPLVKDVNVNYTIPASTFQEIYISIESDLIKAMLFLPSNGSQSRVPDLTPHRGTAKAILAEVYLTWGGYPVRDESKYVLAAKMAGEVIDSADFFGFGLISDYADLWNGKQKFNNETILGLYYSTTGKYDNYGYNNELNNITAYFGMWPDSISRLDWDIIVSPFILANIKFYNNYPAGYRRDVTFQSVLPNSNYLLGLPPSIPVVFIDHKIADSNTPIFYKKFGYYCSADTTTVLYDRGELHFDKTIFDTYFHRIIDQPIYIFRFAHTLLTYAEAKARSGQVDASAYEAINIIRRRANRIDINSSSVYDLTSGLSAIQFADSVVQERKLELCGEMEGRWFDLVRLEMVDQIQQFRGGGPASTYFAKIPESETILNPNLK